MEGKGDRGGMDRPYALIMDKSLPKASGRCLGSYPPAMNSVECININHIRHRGSIFLCSPEVNCRIATTGGIARDYDPVTPVDACDVIGNYRFSPNTCSGNFPVDQPQQPTPHVRSRCPTANAENSRAS